MKIKLTFNRVPQVIVKYEGNEWETIENVLVNQLGLEKQRTTDLFSTRVTAEFYRETNNELKGYLRSAFNSGMEHNILDDINAPLFNGRDFNIAVFRIVPSEDGIVKIKLQKFLNIMELQTMVECMTVVLKTLFSIVLNKEVKITLSEKPEKSGKRKSRRKADESKENEA